MSNVVYCEFCKESFDIKKWVSHRNECKKNPYTIVECRYCKKEFNQDKIQNHLIKCKKNLKNTEEKFIICNCQYCNNRIQEKNLLWHEYNCSKNPKNWKEIEIVDMKKEENKIVTPKKLISKNNNKIFVVCEYCEELIEKNKIEIHFRFNHKYKELKYKPYKEDKSYKGNNVYITNDNGSVEFLGKQEKTEVKLNKNKNILKSNDSYYNSTTKDNTAFSIRDNGKFGSMPLYDNYDEESDA